MALWGWLSAPMGLRRTLPSARLFALAGIGWAALMLAACGPFATAQPGPYYPAIGASTNPTPTVAPVGYTVAAWPSNTAPIAGAPVVIVVAFRDAGQPVVGAQAAISVRPAGYYVGRGYGPLPTDSAGYAGFTLSGEGEAPNQPMLVQVTVIYQGQFYSTSTAFTPAP